MKKLIYLLLFCLCINGICQNSEAQTANKEVSDIIKKSLKKIDKDNSFESFEKESQILERLTNKYKDDWFSNYYLLYFKVSAMMEAKNEDDISNIFDFCIQEIDKLLELSKNEREKSEFYTLKGYLFTALIKSNPEKYGPEYYKNAQNSLEMGIKIKPNNPRAIFLNTMFNEGMAKFMKMDYPFCQELLTANKLFAMELSATTDDLYPNWGAVAVASILIDQCPCKK